MSKRPQSASPARPKPGTSPKQRPQTADEGAGQERSSAAAGASQGSSVFKGIKYNSGMKEGRLISYYFLGSQAPFPKLIQQGVVKVQYNTEFVLDIEHCVDCDKHEMTMRHSSSKYSDMALAVERSFREIVGPYFTTDVVINSNKKKGYPRLGAFEVVLRWSQAGKSSKEVVLFSKLETRRFPVASQLCEHLYETLSSVRQVEVFRVIVKNAGTGNPITQSHGSPYIAMMNETEEMKDYHVPKTGQVDLRKLPFGRYTIDTTIKQPDFLDVNSSAYRDQQRADDDAYAPGRAKIIVGGEYPPNICIPLPPRLADAEVMACLTWASQPLSMKLFLRTPEGLVSPAVAELGHARTLVRDDSNGFGPVSILVQNGVAGMYHLYVQPSKGFEVSNAQVCIFDKTGVIGCYAICPCEPSNGEVWWDVAVFTLDDNGRVTGDIRQLMSFEEEEPGYGVMQVQVTNLLGIPVDGAQVVFSDPAALSSAKSAMEGVTSGGGMFRGRMPYKVYDLEASLPASDPPLASAPALANLRMGGEGVCGVAPLVPTPAAGDIRVVLTWTGKDYAAEPLLRVEMPGVYIRAPSKAVPDDLNTPNFLVSGPHVKSVLLRTPLPTSCHIFVESPEDPNLEHLNLQIAMCMNGAPPIVMRPKSVSGHFWDVCVVHDLEEISPINSVSDVTPSKGETICLRTKNTMDGAPIITAATVVRLSGDPEDPGVALFPGDNGHHFSFLLHGNYIASVSAPGFGTEDRSFRVEPKMKTRPWCARHFCVGLTEDNFISNKQGRIVLTWAFKPAHLHLQIITPEGPCNRENPTRGSVRLETLANVGDDCGPAVVSMRQPISGKFKIQVINPNFSTEGSMFYLQPELLILTSKGRLTTSFKLDRSEPVGTSLTANIEVWTVCLLEIEDYARFDGDSVVVSTQFQSSLSLVDAAHLATAS